MPSRRWNANGNYLLEIQASRTFDFALLVCSPVHVSPLFPPTVKSCQTSVFESRKLQIGNSSVAKSGFCIVGVAWCCVNVTECREGLCVKKSPKMVPLPLWRWEVLPSRRWNANGKHQLEIQVSRRFDFALLVCSPVHVSPLFPPTVEPCRTSVFESAELSSGLCFTPTIVPADFGLQ